MNSTFKFAVVDDVQQDQEALCAMLSSYAAKHGLSWQVDCFSSGEALLEAAADIPYAVVFLDIIMDGMDGIETARRLRAMTDNILVVFITTEAGYAVEGYEVEASGFLIKDEVQRELRFDRLMQRLERQLRTEPMLDLSAYGHPVLLPTRAIFYAEVLDHKMLLHLDRDVVSLRMTMGELKRLLGEDKRFVECHRGILVNLDAVASTGDGVFRMKDGCTVPVSRRRRATLEQAFAARCIARVRGGC